MENIILTVRGMTFDEHCEYEDWREEAIKDKNITPKKLGRLFVHWIFQHIYPDVNIKLLRAKEALMVAQGTMALTEAVRDDELKNLRSSLIGSASEPTTATTAEK